MELRWADSPAGWSRQEVTGWLYQGGSNVRGEKGENVRHRRWKEREELDY